VFPNSAQGYTDHHVRQPIVDLGNTGVPDDNRRHSLRNSTMLAESTPAERRTLAALISLLLDENEACANTAFAKLRARAKSDKVTAGALKLAAQSALDSPAMPACSWITRPTDAPRDAPNFDIPVFAHGSPAKGPQCARAQSPTVPALLPIATFLAAAACVAVCFHASLGAVLARLLEWR
jgi:hypothetical protein